MIGRERLAALIPHNGAMCLLDEVLAFEGAAIRCTASSHRDAANPLRHRGRLGILCGAEYAGQAMAVHGALRDPAAAGARYLAAVRGVICHAARLDDLPGPLIVDAERLAGDAALSTYAFTLTHAGRVLLTGRASVVRRAP